MSDYIIEIKKNLKPFNAARGTAGDRAGKLDERPVDEGNGNKFPSLVATVNFDLQMDLLTTIFETDLEYLNKNENKNQNTKDQNQNQNKNDEDKNHNHNQNKNNEYQNQILFKDSESIIKNRKEDLWKTTCFEFFMKNKNSTRYIEMNVNDSAEWTLFGFENYRQSDLTENNLIKSLAPCRIEVSKGMTKGKKNSMTVVSIQLPLSKTMDAIFGSVWKMGEKSQMKRYILENLQLNLTAVIDRDKIAYWAVHHASEKPDFHNFGSMLELEKLKIS